MSPEAYDFQALYTLTGKLRGKRSLGRPSLRWEDNIRMDHKEIGINTRNWVDSPCESRIEPPGSISQGVS